MGDPLCVVLAVVDHLVPYLLVPLLGLELQGEDHPPDVHVAVWGEREGTLRTAADPKTTSGGPLISQRTPPLGDSMCSQPPPGSD